ncbi:MAG TPA: protein-disulfide reductase DsbD [Thiolinea sp.]|nr:protein-disulfide reductase DsbD [Thiolinea sp.]
MLGTTAGNTFALNQESLLLPDQAFTFQAHPDTQNKIVIEWDIAAGYYLYRKQFQFSEDSPDFTLETENIQYPEGETKKDPTFGDVEVYRGKVSISIPFQHDNPGSNELALKIKYQGCADVGFCYPPQRKTLQLNLAENLPETLPQSATQAQNIKSSQAPLQTNEPPVNRTKPTPPIISPGQTTNTPASASDQAFEFSLQAIDTKTLKARWTIAPDHHLYKEKIRFSLVSPQSATLGQPDFPAGETINDEFLGKVEVYRKNLDVTIPVNLKTDTRVQILTEYQGCAEKTGACYPAVYQENLLDLSGLPDPAAASPDTRPDKGVNAYFRGGYYSTIALFFVIGLGLSLTPCIFPMIPILSGIIAGQSDISARKAFTLSLTYVLASAGAYALIGLAFGYFGQNLQSGMQHPLAISLFAALFVLLALSMFGFYNLQMPTGIQSRLNEISNRQQGGSLISAAIMGFLSTLIVGPCVAPPLAAALTYIADSKDAILGASALFSMGLGLGMPLLVVGTSAGHLLPRAGEWMDTTKAIFGIIMLGMAIYMLDRIVPAEITMALTGILLVTSGISMGALDRLQEESSGWDRFWKSVGLILMFYGGTQLLGVAAGSQNLFQPLKGVFAVSMSSPSAPSAPNSDKPVFLGIKSTAELDRLLAQARQNQQPVMLDFYADWCIDCKRMDRNTFSNPEVIRSMSQSGLLLAKADVTENNADAIALMQRLGIIGPPSLLFFDRDGRLIPELRTIGYTRPEDFLQILERLKSH